MSIDMIATYIRPELLVLVPTLFFIGKGLKNSTLVDDRHIPLLLGAIGVVASAIWMLATSSMAGYQDALMAVFTAFVQGILTAGGSVYVDQVIKQGAKEE